MKILWWLVTPLLSAMMLFSAALYLTENEQMVAAMKHLGYPHYMLYILGTAKLLGVLAVQLPFSPKRLREWAYAGFSFTFLGAIASHLASGDGPEGAGPAGVALALLIVSYFAGRRSGKV
jgi:putative oxidoreductase